LKDVLNSECKKGNFRAQEILEKFVAELSNNCNNSNPGRIGEFCVKFLCESMQFVRACLFFRFVGHNKYIPCGYYEVEPGQKSDIPELTESDPFISEIMDHDDPYPWRQILKVKAKVEWSGLKSPLLNFADFATILPLKNGERLQGILFLGVKTTGAKITRTEAKIIKVIVSFVLICLMITSSAGTIERSYENKQFSWQRNEDFSEFQSSLDSIRQYLHEINNSLTGVLARIDLIRAEPVNEKVGTQLEKLEESAMRTSALLQDLHGFVRRATQSSRDSGRQRSEEA
jgi:hypothetical protein